MENIEKPKTIDAYIALCPVAYRQKLQQLREVIKETVPEATEAIRWNMPSFLYHGILVQFMLHKNHIGFYPFPSGVESFLKESFRYKTGKGSIQFPLKEDIPFELVKKIVRFRAKENKEKRLK